MMKNIKRYICILFVSLMVAFLIRGIGYIMPIQMIQNNINLSMEEINNKGLYPHFGWDLNQWEATNQLDNYTEYILLNHVYLLKNHNFLDSTINNPCAIYETTDPLIALNSIVSKTNYTMENKVQYWWGVSSIYSVLLTVFTYPEMIMFIKLIIWILIAYLSYLFYKEFKLNILCAFMIMIFAIKLNIASSLLITSIVFILSFIMAILILNYKKYNIATLNKWMFITGINTAFWDWLSIPIFSCVFLSVICFLLLLKYNNISNEVKKILYAAGLSIYWGIGYGSMLVSKWIISAIYQGNVWNIVQQRISQGMSNKVDWAPSSNKMYILATIKENLFNINILKLSYENVKIRYVMIIVLVIAIIFLFIFRKHHFSIGDFIGLLILSSIPFVWFVAFKGHSFIHHWFTYRSLGATIFSIWILYTSLIEKQKIVDFFSRFLLKIRRIYENKK